MAQGPACCRVRAGGTHPVALLLLLLLLGCAATAVAAAGGCDHCDCEDHVEYAGGDLLPESFKRPVWWTGEWGGMEGVSPKLASQEACCTFCTEWNRHQQQPPCVVATYTLAPEDPRQLCFPKGPSHQPRIPHADLPRVACVPLPCAADWGRDFLLFALLSAGLYVSGGVTLAVRRSGADVAVRSHPHHGQWREVAGLVSDGVAFTRAGGRRGQEQRPRGGRAKGAAPLLETTRATSSSGRKAKKSPSRRDKESSQSTKETKVQKGAAKQERREVELPPPAVPAPVDCVGGGAGEGPSTSAAGGGGRWVHVTN